jgi:hypothetical protein
MQQQQRFVYVVFGGVMVLLAGMPRAVAVSQTPAAIDTGASFERLRDVLVRHCAPCHSEGSVVPEALDAMALDTLLASDGGALSRVDEWQRIYTRVVTTRSMPPFDGARVMPDADRAVVRAWIDRAFERTTRDSLTAPTLRRLTNYEYNRTTRDLFGIDFDLEGFIQQDSISQGFPNAAAVAFSTPERTQQYLAASEFVARAVLDLSGVLTERRRTWHVSDILAENPNQGFWSSVGRRVLDVRDGVKRGQRAQLAPRLRTTTVRDTSGNVREAIRLADAARFSVRHAFPLTGIYSVRVSAATRSTETASVSVHIDGRALPLTVDLRTDGRRLTTEAKEVRVPRGALSLRVSSATGAEILLGSVEVSGPLIPDDAGARLMSRDRLACVGPVKEATAESRDCARRTIKELAERAFRTGSIDETTVDTLLSPFERALEAGTDFRSALALSIQAVLMDPRFLYRLEADRPGPNRLDDFEFATRLSYFLWASAPDDELRRRAAAGALVESLPEIRRQVRRMLADPKSDALVDAFAAGWLGYSSLGSHVVDTKVLPEFDEVLRQSMLEETRLYLTTFFRENRRVAELFDSQLLFLNERLARHYGIPGVQGSELRRVASPLAQRGGLLTQGSILTVTSNSYRTSVVKRGFWILDRVLCQPVGDPPPVVARLEDSSTSTLTLRQEMERHRAEPACASCHKQIDPLGFSLENYDPSGAWRGTDKGIAIDPSGTLPGSDPPSRFGDFVELRAMLARDARVPTCVIRKLMIYALGRALAEDDERVVQEIAAKTKADGHRVHDVIAEIASSRPLRKER